MYYCVEFSFISALGRHLRANAVSLPDTTRTFTEVKVRPLNHDITGSVKFSEMDYVGGQFSNHGRLSVLARVAITLCFQSDSAFFNNAGFFM